ncbi:conserved hypothetical protein [Sphingobacterium multivorum]|uniref:Uncharacterized protein n=1 Tax=Sphingobacterium multivorum TaxID=28454 RepID=A0A654DE89_SPHMU|nr:conserved hypothetical protein [Sphingobacterium multivorum]
MVGIKLHLGVALIDIIYNIFGQILIDRGLKPTIFRTWKGKNPQILTNLLPIA